MKKVLVMMMVAASVNAMADDYEYLTFEGSEGTLSMAAKGLTITFNNGQMTVVNGNESHTITLSTLSKMYFSNTTGISEAETTPGDNQVEVYATSGMLMGKYDSLDDAKAHLRTGVYIVKSNNKTFKIAVK